MFCCSDEPKEERGGMDEIMFESPNRELAGRITKF
jgi:hypothetical protein